MLTNLFEYFQPVTSFDIPLLKSYMHHCCYEEANHSLVGYFIWFDAYPIWKYVDPNYLLLLGVHEDTYFIYMPYCHPLYYAQALKKGKEIFQSANLPFLCSCINETMLNAILPFVKKYKIQEYREDADYVYTSESLKTFSGKKLQKKRNHLLAFEKQYQDIFEYHILTKQDQQECITFLKEWEKNHKSEMLSYEEKGIERIFSLWDDLDFYGGAIKINGKIEAFSIVSYLSNKMLQVHIEKANINYRGIYQKLCKEVLLHVPRQTEFVNREDDMGIQNLRKAKLAYHPHHLIHKYSILIEE